MHKHREARERLASLNPLYGEMYDRIRNALKSQDAPRKVKAFSPTSHELAVLSALEQLLDNDRDAFLKSDVENGVSQEVERLKGETFERYHRNAAAYGPILRWALLLHDLAKDRGLPGPHPRQSAGLARQVRRAMQAGPAALDEGAIDSIIWLIEHHDVLGNIHTGERAPSFLLRVVEQVSAEKRETLLKLLQIVILCDLRGTAGGQYLTESKAQFWLGLSDQGEIERRDETLFNWRIKRWTGDLFGVDDDARAEALRTIIEQSGRKPLIEETFGRRIDHIVYGFYLFTALSPRRLATLMEVASVAVQHHPHPRVTLEFSTVYKPWETDAENTLERYNRQLDDRQLDYTFDHDAGKLVVR